MSGSSGSNDDYRSGSAGGAGGKSCDIVEQTVLNSPVAAVVAKLAKGAKLNVELEEKPRARLLAKTTAGDTAGSITSASLVELIECIRNGSVYIAEVLSVSGGRVSVEIRPK